MARRHHLLLRLAVLVALVGVLFGVPWVLFILVGVPLPTVEHLRQAWSSQRLDNDLVVSIGVVLFAVLWCWFAATALAETWRVVRARRTVDPLPELPRGASGLVRGVVRFILLSTVTASMVGALVRTTSASSAVGPGSSTRSAASVVSGPSVAARPAALVASGRDTPYSLANELGHPEWRQEIIHLNAGRRAPDGSVWHGGVFAVGMDVLLPGAVSQRDAVVRVASSPVAPGPASANDVHAPGTSPTVAFAEGLGTALLLSAGAVGALEQRRRRQWRAALVGERLSAPTIEAIRTELVLRSLGAAERLARLDVAIRSAARVIAAQGAVVHAALLGPTGDVRLLLSAAAVPADPRWQIDPDSGGWVVDGEVPIEQLAELARGVAYPCPALVHLGETGQGDALFVDLEAIGVLSVCSPVAGAVVRCIGASLSASPFMQGAAVFTVVDEVPGLGDVMVEAVDSLDAAVEAATMVVGSTAALVRGSSTFALRVEGSGEAWEPAVVLDACTSHGDPSLAALAHVRPGRSLAAVIAAPVPGVRWQLLAETAVDGTLMHVLEPLGLCVRPVGLSVDQVESVAEVLRAADRAPVAVDRSTPQTFPPPRVAAPPLPFVEQGWSLLVRVLGPVDVMGREGAVATFERSKSLELLVWLTQHRERPTRSAARTALWDVDVRDATFANVVSEARRGLALIVTPQEGEEWITRTLTDALPVHPLVVSDAELLGARMRHARGLPAPLAIDVLRPGVALLRGMPFAGTGYLWTDAEGLTSSLVMLATSAASELAEHYLAVGDIDGVFWSTGQGLKVLAGHEELISLRMRAHARRGDRAGVRSEWESYERSLAADTWAAADPAPKLVALRRELLS